MTKETFLPPVEITPAIEASIEADLEQRRITETRVQVTAEADAALQDKSGRVRDLSPQEKPPIPQIYIAPLGATVLKNYMQHQSDSDFHLPKL